MPEFLKQIQIKNVLTTKTIRTLGTKYLHLPPLTAAILLMLPQVVLADFKGFILEKGTRRPLKEANLFVLPQKWKVTTDETGAFHLNENPTADNEIVINVSGYKKFSLKLITEYLEATKEKPFIFYIEKESYQYLETTVTGVREKKEAQKTLRQEDFLTMPGSGGDPVKAVQNLPGVNRSVGGDARVVIQGSEPEDTRYNLGGHEVPLIFHFGGLTSIVTPEAVESVDYFSAGYGAEFSRALGGHIGLNVRDPKTDRLHAFAFMDSFNSGGLVEGPIDEQSSFLVTGRYSYIGAVLKEAMKENKDFNLTVAPSFYDLSALYQRRLNDKDDFRLLSILSQDKLEFVLNKPIGNDPKLRGNFYQQTQFQRIIPQWSHVIDETSKLKMSAAYGNNDILADIGTNYFYLKNKALTSRIEYQKELTSNWKMSAGLDTMDDWFNVQIRIPATYNEGGISNPLASGEVKETKVSGHDNLWGVYWRNEWKPEQAPLITVIPQLRWDQFSPTKENLTQPRLALRYQCTDDLTLKASTGVYYQLPQPQESDSYYGNPDLKTAKALHYLVGFERDLRQGGQNGLQINGALFYKNLDRLVIPSAKLVERNGTQTFENYANRGKGHVQGLELQVKYKDNSDIQWIGSYTYVRSRRQQPGLPELPSQYDQTHSLNILTSYQWENWQVGSRLRFVTGTPYTPIIGASFDSDNDVYIPQRGSLFSARNANFFQWDLRADRKWIYDTWILSSYIDIQNLTNAKNQEGLTYAYDYSQEKPITGLPILPSIGVKGEF